MQTQEMNSTNEIPSPRPKKIRHAPQRASPSSTARSDTTYSGHFQPSEAEANFTDGSQNNIEAQTSTIDQHIYEEVPFSNCESNSTDLNNSSARNSAMDNYMTIEAAESWV